MLEQIFSWATLLTAVGLTGFILAGRKVWWCWYINIACQGLWLAYALVTHQYGFIVASVIYTIVFTQNAIKWTREHREAVNPILHGNGHPLNTPTFGSGVVEERKAHDSFYDGRRDDFNSDTVYGHVDGRICYLQIVGGHKLWAIISDPRPSPVPDGRWCALDHPMIQFTENPTDADRLE